MKNFQLLASNVDIVPLLLELHRQPKLWNQHTPRTAGGGAHGEVDDIWARFRAFEELKTAEDYAAPHTPVMYPAWHALPSLRPLVFSLMTRVQAVQLGGILITRIPPGRSVKPHDDRGRWHAEFMNTKVYIPLQANDACFNECDGERVVMRAGDAWVFNNLLSHSVVNEGPTDRMTLIVSMRCE